jgi:hypothetical protein
MSSLKKLTIFLSFILGIILLISIDSEDLREKNTIYKEVYNIDAISLSHSTKFGNLSYGWARCSGFKQIRYNGYDHYYMGSGATLSIVGSESQPQISVIENVITTNVSEWVEKLELKIIDTSNGEIIAKREVWQTEDRLERYGKIGYPSGKVAARFVHDTLKPRQNFSNSCVKRYPKTVYESEVSEIDLEINKSILFSRSTNCSDISIQRYEHRLDVRVVAPEWTYQTKSHPNHVYCNNDEIFVFHSVFWDELYIDWLDKSGVLKGQYEIRNKNDIVTADLKYDYIDSVILSDDTLKVVQSQISPSIKAGEDYKGKAVQSVFKINLLESEGRNHWCKKTGETNKYSINDKSCVNIPPPNPIKSLNKSNHSDSKSAAGV